MTVGLAIMRLQPLHKGHQQIIDAMLAENEKAVLMIGSVGVQDENNPYSYEERVAMIHALYHQEIKAGHLLVSGLEDIHNLPKWVDYVKSQLPIPADRYYCGVYQNAQQFREKGFAIREFDRDTIKVSGTEIRHKMQTGDISWQNDVPTSIALYLQHQKNVCFKKNPINKFFTSTKKEHRYD